MLRSVERLIVLFRLDLHRGISAAEKADQLMDLAAELGAARAVVAATREGSDEDSVIDWPHFAEVLVRELAQVDAGAVEQLVEQWAEDGEREERGELPLATSPAALSCEAAA